MGVKIWAMQPDSFRQACRYSRERLRLSQAAVAALAGISQTYYSEIERGIKEPSRDAVVRICKALELPEDETLFKAGFLPLSAVDVARNSLEAALLASFRAGDERAKRMIATIVREMAAG